MTPMEDLNALRDIIPDLTPREVRLLLVFARALKEGRERCQEAADGPRSA